MLGIVTSASLILGITDKSSLFKASLLSLRLLIG